MTLVPPSGREKLDSKSSSPPDACPARPAARSKLDSVRAVLADLGSHVRHGSRIEEPLPRLETGLLDVDRLLGGGLPGGRLSEIHGAPSSGRTSLVLSLLAGLTRNGQCVGVVDRADAFDPASARDAGVVLERVLWARTPAWRETLCCAERLLEADGFPLVLIDAGARSTAPPPDAAWLRLARGAAASRTALVLLSGERLAGTHPEVVLQMQSIRVGFEGEPALLEKFETRALLVRHRAAPTGLAASVRWRASSAA